MGVVAAVAVAAVGGGATSFGARGKVTLDKGRQGGRLRDGCFGGGVSGALDAGGPAAGTMMRSTKSEDPCLPFFAYFWIRGELGWG